jgi:hypothetical protein
VRRRRPGGGRGGAGRPGGGRGGARGQSDVERPRTDEQATSAEGREQPAVEPETQATPEAVAETPEATTEKTTPENPTQEKPKKTESTRAKGSGGRGSKKAGS